MASTNKTTNYELSQFIGTDKPTYLGDYNGDMLKIDTQMKTNADNASSAYTLADTAKTTADTAETHAQTGITNAGTAQSTASSALAKATANETAIAKFNLSDITAYTDTITIENASVLNNDKKITVATNADGSIGKIYGKVTVGNVVSQSLPVRIIIPYTNLRPESNINISGNSLCFNYDNNGINSYDFPSIEVYTNGSIIVEFNPSSNLTSYSCAFINSILFMTDFGD